ncbi:hypothetical protein AJ79_01661 [Helicocarpus griseus UAMH5409]|uniref:Peptidase S9 prolyl oligopeptidase catalytic domain-containing protein n=1 Tax=Helicocarpus griseus UAMH5409 TaxID=1447875 RepID=A0A2B7Y5S3_9EURO|nr:hypothetical protein AJ79_01661 [Helicocarpus griseus UAMH5409]
MASMSPVIERSVAKAPTTISLSNEWQVLGPFKTGTREAAWGADPLEILGGFRNLSYGHDPQATFPSALGINGKVGWSIVEAAEIVNSTNKDGSATAKATLDVGFPGIDWPFLRSIYGWAALQFQAWARGVITVAGSGADDGLTVALFTDGLLEFWVDGELYFGGDFYTYRRAPVVVKLAAGEHVVDLRLVRDVRALGGVGEPRIRTVVEVQQRSDDEVLEFDADSLLAGEIVGGRLASPFASLIVGNNRDVWAEVTDIQIVGAVSTGLALSLLDAPITLAPYQSRPVAFRIDFGEQASSDFSFLFSYKVEADEEVRETKAVTVNLTQRTMEEAQKYTFLHPGGIVSYAILRPPLNKTCELGGKRKLPVFVDLHGAGLEADSDQVRHMLDAAYGVCAWMLFPTGVTPWSGDDWHTWGAADVQAAVAAIPDWMEAVAWEGPGVTLGDWLMSGHSNGGQGTWFFLTHQPDKVIAAAPVSGYSSIENYVPFTMWHDGQAAIASVIQTSRQSFKHELLMENFAGTPILQQHGSADDNVPAYHSRLLHQLIWENKWQSDYHELPGKGHWFDGVLVTPQLLDFYSSNTNQPSYDHLLPEKFSFSVPNSGDMGSRGGIMVDQLTSPDKNGRIQVAREAGGLWRLKTRNVHRFHLIFTNMRVTTYPTQLIVDDSQTPFAVPAATNATWFVKDEVTGSWAISGDDSWQDISQRHGRQNGAMDAILRTQGRFTIRICSTEPESDKIALQASRNLLQYFGADSQILRRRHANCTSQTTEPTRGNLITLSTGSSLPAPLHPSYPITISQTHLALRLATSITTSSSSFSLEPGLGAIFLRPLPNQRLELVVWGADAAGLRQASRLVPLVTGVGQPDFVVLGPSCGWTGVVGVYAAGFLGWEWGISGGSFVI